MTRESELLPCPVCAKIPTMRPGVCTNEIELQHQCLMGHIVNRGGFGDVWKTEKRAKAKSGMTPWNKGVPATCDHKNKLSKSWNRDALRNVDKNLYRFERDCGDVFVGTRLDFCKYSNISHKYVYKIVSKNQHKTKGWRAVWESVVIL